MNGDVLTNLPYHDLLRAHREAGNVVTIATHARTIEVDYGVMRVEDHASGPRIVGYEEKPQIPVMVSMGIYVLEPSALAHVPAGRHFDFPELVQAVLEAGDRVGAYPFEGLWFDIGRKDDYELAVATWTELRPALEPAGQTQLRYALA
jgi:NDP-sugar pyrophosphorylase family protein